MIVGVSKPLISVKALSRYYGSHCAVDNIEFEIEPNSVVGFLGLNGAGKSTTLKVLAGLLLPSAGTVLIGGIDMSQAPSEFRKRIGFLPEEPPLYLEMTVLEYLYYVGSLRECSGAELAERMPGIIKNCQLTGQENRMISELSHGYRKRVGIAQAIVHKPDLVILDEPISGLDPVQREEMCGLIRGLSATSTVLFSSHNLREIGAACDSVLVLHEGRLVKKGTEASLAKEVSSGCSLSLSLRASREAVEAFLAGLEGVVESEIGAEAEGCIELSLVLGTDTREALVEALVKAGLGLRRMEDTKDELEEIFDELIRDGGAA